MSSAPLVQILELADKRLSANTVTIPETLVQTMHAIILNILGAQQNDQYEAGDSVVGKCDRGES